MQFDERVVIDYSSFLEENTDCRPELLNDSKKKFQENLQKSKQLEIPMNGSSGPFDGQKRQPWTKTNHIPNPQLVAQVGEQPPEHELLPGVPRTVGKGYDPLLACPARLPAFGLQGKMWGHVLIDDLAPVAWKRGTFEALQIDGDTKELIQSLTKGHQKDERAAFDDIVPGKGRGLVFLLHG